MSESSVAVRLRLRNRRFLFPPKEEFHPRPLPATRQWDGRPTWEPPTLDYSDMIDPEEHEKMREAIIKFSSGDVVEATAIEDLNTERKLVARFEDWVRKRYTDEPEEAKWFYDNLQSELRQDEKEIHANIPSDDNIYVFRAAASNDWVVRNDEFHLQLTRLEEASSMTSPRVLKKLLENDYGISNSEYWQDKEIAALKLDHMKSLTTRSEQLAWVTSHHDPHGPFWSAINRRRADRRYYLTLSTCSSLNPQGFWGVPWDIHVSSMPLAFRVIGGNRGRGPQRSSKDACPPASKDGDEVD